MGLLEILLIAVGVSMDAFAISICKGLSVRNLQRQHLLITGAWFGGAQVLMPLIGYFLGNTFANIIADLDHWITFVLLGLIGINMIREAFKSEQLDADFSVKAMLPLSIADSIDALAIGVTLSFYKLAIIPTVLIIGVTTFLFSGLGIYIGNRFGTVLKSKAELLGGAILITIGTLILLGHTGII